MRRRLRIWLLQPFVSILLIVACAGFTTDDRFAADSGFAAAANLREMLSSLADIALSKARFTIRFAIAIAIAIAATIAAMDLI